MKPAVASTEDWRCFSVVRALYCWGIVISELLLVNIPQSLAQPAPSIQTTDPVQSASKNSLERDWSVDYSADLNSSYIFRGKRLYNGASLQPAVRPRYTISDTRSIDLLLWGHLPVSADSFSEVDQSASFSQKYSRATFSLGHRSYFVTDADSPLRSRSEVWGAMALDTMLNPVFSVYYDYTRYNQQFYLIKLNHTFEKSGEGAFNVTFFSDFGYVTNGEELYSANGLVQITSGVSTALHVGRLRLVPRISYTSAADDRSRNSLWGGVTIEYSQQ